jgi:hypothetical protein
MLKLIDKLFKESRVKVAAAVLFIVAFVVAVVVIGMAGYKSLGFWHGLSLDASSKFGDFIGGVVGTLVAAAAYMLIYLTFISQDKLIALQQETMNEQQRANEAQQKFIEFEKAAREREQVEGRFFVLLEAHITNTNALIYLNPVKKKDVVHVPDYKGKDVFGVMFRQVKECMLEIHELIKDLGYQKIYKKKAFLKLQSLQEKTASFDLYHSAIMEIAYCIVYFGVEEDAREVKNLLVRIYDTNVISAIVTFLLNKPHIDSDLYSTWLSEKKSIQLKFSQRLAQQLASAELVNDSFEGWIQFYEKLNFASKRNYYRYYRGFQSVVSSYYRSMYQTVTFINKYGGLKFDEKYEYIKTLRAQLTINEQQLLFFNSISFLGRIWEVDSLLRDGNVNEQLITKYNLIKNIPVRGVLGISFSHFYPNVDFDNGSSSFRRAELEKQYI